MLCTPKGDEPEGKHHGYALGSTQEWSWRGKKKEEKKEESNNFEITFFLLLHLLFSVLQAQAVEVFPEQRLGTNGVNVQGARIPG